MELNFLAFAVPFFVSLMLLEYYLSIRRNKKVHQFAETIANLNVGIAERLCDLLTTGGFYFVFSWLHSHMALFEIKASLLSWILLFLFTDLLWYWYHRVGHKVNLFWAAHVVHHQSEDFNYSVSARITLVQAVARGLFWCVLPLIGFPAHMITLLLLFHGAYPFFTHTQLVGKLGWLEYFLVTPSHHRVHHSSNPEYLDKNFGDVLIIWDKLFGTFAEERATPVYGLTKPLGSHSFLWQHFHFLLEMLVSFKLAKGLRGKLRILFGRPDDIDPRVRTYLERSLLQKKDAPALSATLCTNILVQTILTITLLFAAILFEAYLSAYQLSLATLFILLSVVNTGAMLEQRKMVFYIDVLRFSMLSLLLDTFYPNTQADTILLLLLVIILLFHKALRRQYCGYLYC
jgi:alkylglycerol monooxygenase